MISKINTSSEDIIQRLNIGIQTFSPNEMHGVAEKLSATLPSEAFLALHGDLGTGKSTFVAGLAKSWRIQQPTTSPTFNIFHVYRGLRCLVHMDAYRLNHASQMQSLMLEDFLTPPFCVAIEWAENILEWLPEDTLHLYLKIEAPGVHSVILKKSIQELEARS